MLDASFDALRNRGASVSGAYQYDTGQRIRMHGLPSPDDLAERDEFLSGDIVAVQVQFAYKGDSQSEPRYARYDEEEDCWFAEIPDTYLTRAEPVFLYVYVMYGADEDQSRSKTMYTGSFTPIARPAPSTAVTPDQKNAWDALVGEVNLTLSEMGTAISGANAAATGAKEAAEQARSAAQSASSAASAANAMTAKWETATASAETLQPGSEATVELAEGEGGAKHFTIGVPKGEKGDKGDTGPAGVTFRLEGTVLYIDTV